MSDDAPMSDLVSPLSVSFAFVPWVTSRQSDAGSEIEPQEQQVLPYKDAHDLVESGISLLTEKISKLPAPSSGRQDTWRVTMTRLKSTVPRPCKIAIIGRTGPASFLRFPLFAQKISHRGREVDIAKRSPENGASSDILRCKSCYLESSIFHSHPVQG